MGSFFVRIDVNSLKENPDYGQTRTTISGLRRITFKTKKLPSFFKDGENCHITSFQPSEFNYLDDNVEKEYEGIIIDSSLVDRCIEEKVEGILINEDVQPINIQLPPQPKYIFNYQDKELECSHCNKKIKLSELTSNSYSDNYSNYICPHCGTWDCVDLIFEDIEDCLKKNPKIILKSNNVMVDSFLVDYTVRYNKTDLGDKIFYYISVDDISIEGKSVKKSLNNNFNTYQSIFKRKLIDKIENQEGFKNYTSIDRGLSGYFD